MGTFMLVVVNSSLFSLFFVCVVVVAGQGCIIPTKIVGSWFYRENGEDHTTEINADSMTGRGVCISSSHSHNVNYTFVFHHPNAGSYHCVKFFVRTVNIMDKIECKY